ncbi:hypothetical protein H310_13754 [Aphanomyces invadans]|uniref:Uncharacterized protein n=1 Tax=Aphanomyces invadans TaxID=157072 RepID=A0A024TE92_9STRA|nr:hypothetical protein H310_13754 [Aphanomyces invadans]ETV91677.1 hypothetical protein H310_13754 [Aphanomyces invadans]|eukprot:XP_008879603.1 hypothetical protein H310_13754 [Aphanomyces invadans]
MASPPCKARDGAPGTTKPQKKQWNSSTKLHDRKMPKFLPPSSVLRKEELPVTNDEPSFTEDARLLVEKAVESAVRREKGEYANPVGDSRHHGHMHAKTTRWPCDSAAAEGGTHGNAPTSILDVDIHLERVRAEQNRRKTAIQAFHRHLERQIQQLKDMAEAAKEREAAMDAAFDEYVQLIRLQHASTP